MALGSPFGKDVERVYDLDDDKDLQVLGLNKSIERADRIIHFVECHHVVIEDKGRSQPVRKAIAQLESTIERVKLTNIKSAIIVKEKIPRIEEGLFHWNHVTMQLTKGHSIQRPVTLTRDLPLFMLTPLQAKAYRLI